MAGIKDWAANKEDTILKERDALNSRIAKALKWSVSMVSNKTLRELRDLVLRQGEPKSERDALSNDIADAMRRR
jgi:hypothetical protein